MRRQAAHGSHVRISVSISDEKPLHMRRFREEYHEGTHDEFQSQTRSRSTCDTQASGNTPTMKGFQSQTRSRSTCDPSLIAFGLLYPEFQTQTRSRSTCHTEVRDRSEGKWPVSISDEKPLHMRPKVAYALFWLDKLFQSQTRSRSTCDCSVFRSWAMLVPRFNLRREAAPHATLNLTAPNTIFSHYSCT